MNQAQYKSLHCVYSLQQNKTEIWDLSTWPKWYQQLNAESEFYVSLTLKSVFSLSAGTSDLIKNITDSALSLAFRAIH